MCTVRLTDPKIEAHLGANGHCPSSTLSAYSARLAYLQPHISSLSSHLPLTFFEESTTGSKTNLNSFLKAKKYKVYGQNRKKAEKTPTDTCQTYL